MENEVTERPASWLQIGDMVAGRDGELLEVVSIERDDKYVYLNLQTTMTKCRAALRLSAMVRVFAPKARACG